MHRYFLTPFLVMLLSMNAWSQSPEPDPETEPGDEASTAEPAAENAAENADENADENEDEIDVSELEEESYADADEEDFVPTEDIPTDQAIPFPTDI